MYYIGKLIQAAGLTIILIDYFRKFPELMSRVTLVFGIGMFIVGWALNQYLLRK